ncbi:hypothetical protein D3C80_1609340 [compost metagenome]
MRFGVPKVTDAPPKPWAPLSSTEPAVVSDVLVCLTKLLEFQNSIHEAQVLAALLLRANSRGALR